MSEHGFWKPAPVQQQLRNDDSVFREDSVGAILYPQVSAGTNHSHSHSSGPPSSLQQQRRLLPIYKHRRQILYAVEHFSVVVIVGETGSGKSTQIPQYLNSEGGWTKNAFRIVATEPRRLAAITLAQRVAQEMNDTKKTKVGYTVRFDDQTTHTTKIKYATDGILLQEATHGDPLLSRYSVVILDEAHERTLNSDALLGLLRKIRRQRQTSLRIVVCSATLDATRFLEFFIGKQPNNDPNKDFLSTGTIISVDGRQHPVDVLYLEQPAPDYLNAMIEAAWKIHSTYENLDHDDNGDILCFLPTAEDIDRAVRLAEDYFDRQEEARRGGKGQPAEVDCLPLYGTLPFQMQARIFQQQDPQQQQSSRSRKHKHKHSNNKQRHRRRIIFATNIAETSVSVPRIRYVIDSGLVKLPYFDPVAGLERLLVGPISQASAQQRTGRAGRVCAGKCYRLYTESYFTKQLQPHTPPEILRTNLTGFILTLKSLGVDNILAFELMDVPSIAALQHGLESLYALGCIDDDTEITADGLDVAAFPVEPRVARMLLQSLVEGCSWEVLAVASALQVRDLWQGRPRQHHSSSSSTSQTVIDYEAAMAEIADVSGDHVTYANLFAVDDDRGGMDQSECRDRFVNYLALRRGLEVRNQLARFLRKFGKVRAVGLSAESAGGDVELHRSQAIRRCVTAGFFFNVAKLGSDGRYYTLRNQILVTPAANSILTTHSLLSSEYIVFGETVDGARGGIELKSVSAIEAKWLRELAPHYWE